MFNLFKKNNGKTSNYKFQDPENTACFVCDHVLNRQRPILHVIHEEDGYWQFLCGHDGHDESNAKIISLKQATEIDNTINDLYEMPLGVGADRKSTNDKWEPYKLPADIPEITTTLLTEKEFKLTFTANMNDVTRTAEPIVDIWPYVEQLTADKIVDQQTFDNALVEKVYRNQTNTFDQILLPTPDKNVFIVILVDLIKKNIKGHYRLDLNIEYDLT